MSEQIGSDDAVVGLIAFADLASVFGQTVVVKRKRKTKTGKTPTHELYIVIEKSAVQLNSEKGQEFLRARLFGKTAAAAAKQPAPAAAAKQSAPPAADKKPAATAPNQPGQAAAPAAPAKKSAWTVI